MNFTSSMIDSLRSDIQKKLSEKRYLHTLGVERMALKLGAIILPEKTDELSVAALLHDVAKEISYDSQIALIQKACIKYTDEDIAAKPALHSISALAVIKNSYPRFATNDICSAVYNHTLGAPNMSLFDEIIFISDYIEDGRTYQSCIEVRKYVEENIKYTNSHSDNLRHLHIASLRSIEQTIASLKDRNERIHSKTYKTQNYLKGII